jgi:hypothetical protein
MPIVHANLPKRLIYISMKMMSNWKQGIVYGLEIDLFEIIRKNIIMPTKKFSFFFWESFQYIILNVSFKSGLYIY